MLDNDLEKSLNDAYKYANWKRHEFMTVEHLLLALLGNDSSAKVLNACGVQLEELKTPLEKFINATTPVVDVSRKNFKNGVELKQGVIMTFSRHWASNVYYSGLFFMCNPLAKVM